MQRNRPRLWLSRGRDITRHCLTGSSPSASLVRDAARLRCRSASVAQLIRIAPPNIPQLALRSWLLAPVSRPPAAIHPIALLRFFLSSIPNPLLGVRLHLPVAAHEGVFRCASVACGTQWCGRRGCIKRGSDTATARRGPESEQGSRPVASGRGCWPADL